MLTLPNDYQPYSAVRKVGARIRVESLASLPRKHTKAEFVNAGSFTADSDPLGLLDGDLATVSAVTSQAGGQTAIKLKLSKSYPPDHLAVCLDSSSSLPYIIMVTWQDGELSSTQVINPESMGEGVFIFSKPEDMDKPGGAVVEFSNQEGIRIKQLILSEESEEELTVTQRHICSLEIKEQADVTARSFKPRKLTAEFIPPDDYDMSGFLDLSGRMVKAEIEINGSYINAGEYYIDSFVSLDGGLKYRLMASDIVAKIARYPTGLYVSFPATVRELISWGSGAVAGLEFAADDYSLDAVVFPHMLKDIDSQRDCLLLMSQAARMSSIWTDRAGRVRISCLHKREGTDGQIPKEGILSYVSDTIGPKYMFVKVLGENPSGEVYAYSGSYQLGSYAQVLKNNFLAQTETQTVADNFLEALNLRRRIVLKTRCDPTIEIGDRLKVFDRNGEAKGVFLLVSQTIRFDDEGLSAVMELAR